MVVQKCPKVVQKCPEKINCNFILELYIFKIISKSLELRSVTIKVTLLMSRFLPRDLLNELSKMDQRNYPGNAISFFKGYQNLQHSCFIISWMQSMFSALFFVQELKKLDSDSNPTTQLLLEILNDLESDKSSKRMINLSKFIQKWKGWMGSQYLPKTPDGYLEPQDVSDFHVAMVDSLDQRLADLYSIEIKKTIQSLNSVNSIHEQNPLLFIDIEKGSIQQGIHDYFENDFIDDNILINCKITKLPEIFCIGLKRVIVDLKSNQTVSIPMFLNLSQYCDDEEEIQCKNFKIKSICYHVGKEISNGHWKTLKLVYDHWVLCDDRSVIILDSNEIPSKISLKELENEILQNSAFLTYEACEDL